MLTTSTTFTPSTKFQFYKFQSVGVKGKVSVVSLKNDVFTAGDKRCSQLKPIIVELIIDKWSKETRETIQGAPKQTNKQSKRTKKLKSHRRDGRSLAVERNTKTHLSKSTFWERLTCRWSWSWRSIWRLSWGHELRWSTGNIVASMSIHASMRDIWAFQPFILNFCILLIVYLRSQTQLSVVLALEFF